MHMLSLTASMHPMVRPVPCMVAPFWCVNVCMWLHEWQIVKPFDKSTI